MHIEEYLKTKEINYQEEHKKIIGILSKKYVFDEIFNVYSSLIEDFDEIFLNLKIHDTYLDFQSFMYSTNIANLNDTEKLGWEIERLLTIAFQSSSHLKNKATNHQLTILIDHCTYLLNKCGFVMKNINDPFYGKVVHVYKKTELADLVTKTINNKDTIDYIYEYYQVTNTNDIKHKTQILNGLYSLYEQDLLNDSKFKSTEIKGKIADNIKFLTNKIVHHIKRNANNEIIELLNEKGIIYWLDLLFDLFLNYFVAKNVNNSLEEIISIKKEIK